MHRYHNNKNKNTVRVVDKGDRFVWVLDGDVLHRDGDLPAILHRDGTQEWYQYGLRHRDKGQPAYIGANGTKVWWRAGQYYRPNGLPAIEYADGGRVHVYHTARPGESGSKDVAGWWLSLLAFIIVLLTVLVVCLNAVPALLSAVYDGGAAGGGDV